MDNKSDYQLLIMQDTIEEKRQDYDEKTKNTTEDLTSMITSMVDQIKISKSSPEKRDSSKAQDTTTMVLDNNRAPPLEGVHSTKNGGMWTLKHEISSPKFYEIIIKTELKGDTALDLKNFYKHITMFLNAVTGL